MVKQKKYMPYSSILALLFAGLIACILGSVVLGRYPIGFREMCGIIASRFVDIEPFWKPVQASLLLQHRVGFLDRIRIHAQKCGQYTPRRHLVPVTDGARSDPALNVADDLQIDRTAVVHQKLFK